MAVHVAFPADEAQQLLKNTKIAPYDYTGTVTLTNFVVADQPFVARLSCGGEPRRRAQPVTGLGHFHEQGHGAVQRARQGFEHP